MTIHTAQTQSWPYQIQPVHANDANRTVEKHQNETATYGRGRSQPSSSSTSAVGTPSDSAVARFPETNTKWP